MALIGTTAERTLFAGEDPLGADILVGGVSLRVIGVLKSMGTDAHGLDRDNEIVVPISTAMRRLMNVDTIRGAKLLVREPGQVAEATREITRVLRERHSIGPDQSDDFNIVTPVEVQKNLAKARRVFVGVRESKDLDFVEKTVRTLLRERHLLGRCDLPDDFAIQNQLRFISAQQKTARLLGYLTSGLAAISLLVGGTGILALMLLSVRERTPEIGLRMAVGARSRDILLQFLSEAMVLALAGGIAGAGLGALGAWVVSIATQWPVRVSVGAGLVSLGMAATIGFVFGVLPARKAALLPPIRALGLE